jgi:hypothetical protein
MPSQNLSSVRGSLRNCSGGPDRFLLRVQYFDRVRHCMVRNLTVRLLSIDHVPTLYSVPSYYVLVYHRKVDTESPSQLPER